MKYFSNPYLDKIYRFFSFSSSFYKAIFNVAAGLRADAYHFHDFQLNRIGRKLKNLPHKPVVIYDVHEPYPEAFRYAPVSGFPAKIINFFYSIYVNHWELKCSRYYDMVIATEENVAGKFERYLKNKNKISIIYNYTNLNPDSKLTSPENKTFDAIYTGSIRSTRGVFQIIEAVRIASEKGYHLKILLIGPVFEKGLNEKISRVIQKYDLTDSIVYMKPVPYHEIEKYYHQSKIGLIIFNDNPVNRTILPIKLFEYMAFGLPVICSDFGHMKTYTERNNTGLTVNPHNPADICEKLVSLVVDIKLFKAKSDNCIAAVKNHYNWNIMDKKLVELYKNLLSKNVY